MYVNAFLKILAEENVSELGDSCTTPLPPSFIPHEDFFYVLPILAEENMT